MQASAPYRRSLSVACAYLPASAVMQERAPELFFHFFPYFTREAGSVMSVRSWLTSATAAAAVAVVSLAAGNSSKEQEEERSLFVFEGEGHVEPWSPTNVSALAACLAAGGGIALLCLWIRHRRPSDLPA